MLSIHTLLVIREAVRSQELYASISKLATNYWLHYSFLSASTGSTLAALAAG